MVLASPPALLRPYVREYTGWIEHMASPLCRRELPTEVVPVIFNFGAPIRIFDRRDPSRWTSFNTFSTGAYDTHVLVGSAGPSSGLQVNFTILGARLFFGHPLSGLTNRVVPLEDLVGASAHVLTHRLRDPASWDARFAIVDEEIERRFAMSRAVCSEVTWAWERLYGTRGRVRVGGLVDDIGWSQKHLIARFRDEFGLPPKVLGRVLRFGHAVSVIKRSGGIRFADLAAQCGYFDQAHFSRDVHQFAGVSPTELVKSLLPDQGGFQVDL
jgi:AraC-like DNA-binding protein